MADLSRQRGRQTDRQEMHVSAHPAQAKAKVKAKAGLGLRNFL